MKKTLPFILFVISLSMTNLKAQCKYESKVQEFKNKANSVGTKKSSNGSQGYLGCAGSTESGAANPFVKMGA